MKTEKEITTLPWDSAPSGPNMESYFQSYALANHEKQQLVAGFFFTVEGGRDQAEANAKFVERAVNGYAELLEQRNELLEALKTLIEFDGISARERARAAIERAEKGQP